MKNNDEKLLSVKEAADYLNISTVMLNRKLRSGEIESYKIGRRVLFSKEAHLFPFLEKCKRPIKSQENGNGEN